MKQISEMTGKTYYDEDVYYYRNITQCIFWIERGGCKPIDVFVSGDHKLVMAFSKVDHKRMMSLWMANKENNTGDNNAECRKKV